MAIAPYYQMRGQFTNANTHFVSDDVDQYDLSPHDAALYADHQSSETPIISLEENHNFVELLEAATTAAAGQAVQAMNTDSAAGSGRGKRKRVSSSPVEEPSIGQGRGEAVSDLKRARKDAPTDPQLHGTEGIERGRSESSSVPPPNESLLNDARAAGVHSAAALFRRSSEKPSRKYTRPPMSKLFMSLQLTPENFLHLQAQAKSYMLDAAHPERQSCVGNRGKGDTDMVKLRLFNCVREFLNAGVGDQFFGENVEKPAEDDAIKAARALGEEKAPTEDRLLWPRDGNKIISLVTPLLRRMVTNERQRMYAIETRKGGAKRKETSVEAAPVPDNNVHGTNDPHDPGQQTEHLQTFNLPPHLRPLAPVQPQSQQLYLTSSIPSLPAHSSNVAQPVTPELAMESRKYKESPRKRYQLPIGQKLDLPKEPPAEPVLDFLNIFITKVMPPWRGNVRPTPSLLPVETRLEDSPEAPLFYMSWEELQYQVRLLVREAVWLYPALEPEPEPEPKILSPPPKSSGMGPEALRGLAVAATEIQAVDAPENANYQSVEENKPATVENPLAGSSAAASSTPTSPIATSPTIARSLAAVAPTAASPTAASPTTASPTAASPTSVSPTSQKRVSFVDPLPTPPPKPNATTRGLTPRPLGQLARQKVPAAMQRPSTVLPETRLPKYKIETQWTLGLRAITCREEWDEVKLDIAYALWADKVMNLVVTIP